MSAGEDGSSVELGEDIRDHDGRGSAASSSKEAKLALKPVWSITAPLANQRAGAAR